MKISRLLSAYSRHARAVLGLVALGWVFTLYLTLSHPIYDFGWQLRTGEWILREGGWPRQDPFSWTSQGEPFVAHEWLVNVLFYWMYAHLPSWTLVVYRAALGTAVVGLVFATARARSGSYWPALLVALLAAIGLGPHVDIRPGMFSFLFLALLLGGLHGYRQGRLPRLPWYLPALFALWSNLHGGLILGLGVLLLWTAGHYADLRLQSQPPERMRPLAVSAALCVAATGLNPNGYQILAYPLWVLGHPQVMDQVMEWQSPDFHQAGTLVFELLLFGALLACGARRPRSTADLLVLLAVAHAALTATRNIGFFAVAAPPLMAEGLVVLRRAWRCRFPAAELDHGPRLLFTALATGVLTAASFQAAPRSAPAEWFREAGRLEAFPEEAAARLRAGEWPGRLYNHYDWGGYLIWQLYPDRLVFIDGRAEVHYASGAYEDAIELSAGKAGCLERLERREVRTIVTRKGDRLVTLLEYDGKRRWEKVFTGKNEVVYVWTGRTEPGTVETP